MSKTYYTVGIFVIGGGQEKFEFHSRYETREEADVVVARLLATKKKYNRTACVKTTDELWDLSNMGKFDGIKV